LTKRKWRPARGEPASETISNGRANSALVNSTALPTVAEQRDTGGSRRDGPRPAPGAASRARVGSEDAPIDVEFVDHHQPERAEEPASRRGMREFHVQHIGIVISTSGGRARILRRAEAGVPVVDLRGEVPQPISPRPKRSASRPDPARGLVGNRYSAWPPPGEKLRVGVVHETLARRGRRDDRDVAAFPDLLDRIRLVRVEPFHPRRLIAARSSAARAAPDRGSGRTGRDLASEDDLLRELPDEARASTNSRTLRLSTRS